MAKAKKAEGPDEGTDAPDVQVADKPAKKRQKKSDRPDWHHHPIAGVPGIPEDAAKHMAHVGQSTVGSFYDYTRLYPNWKSIKDGRPEGENDAVADAVNAYLESAGETERLGDRDDWRKTPVADLRKMPADLATDLIGIGWKTAGDVVDAMELAISWPANLPTWDVRRLDVLARSVDVHLERYGLTIDHAPDDVWRMASLALVPGVDVESAKILAGRKVITVGHLIEAVWKDQAEGTDVLAGEGEAHLDDVVPAVNRYLVGANASIRIGQSDATTADASPDPAWRSARMAEVPDLPDCLAGQLTAVFPTVGEFFDYVTANRDWREKLTAFKLSELSTVRTAVDAFLASVGLPALPVSTSPADVVQATAQAVPDASPEPAVPGTVAPTTIVQGSDGVFRNAETAGDRLDAYDRGAAALIWQEEIKEEARRVDRLKTKYLLLKESAADAKKAWESAREELTELELAEPKQMPLFDQPRMPTNNWSDHQATTPVADVKAIAEQTKEYSVPIAMDVPADQSPPADAEDLSWRDLKLADAGLSPGRLEKLDDIGFKTAGHLADWTNGGHKLEDIPGIGKKAAEKIADQVAAMVNAYLLAKAKPDPDPQAVPAMTEADAGPAPAELAESVPDDVQIGLQQAKAGLGEAGPDLDADAKALAVDAEAVADSDWLASRDDPDGTMDDDLSLAGDSRDDDEGDDDGMTDDDVRAEADGD